MAENTPTPISRLSRLKSYFKGKIPTPKDIHGTFLHKVFGEKVFDMRLWWPNRWSFAGGCAVGTFVALTPTISIQMLVSGVICFFLRYNIPVALAICWITNPLTAPFFYTYEYEFGLWLTGAEGGTVQVISSNFLHDFLNFAKQFLTGDWETFKALMIGSMVISIVSGVVAWIGAYAIWGWLSLLNRKYFHLSSSHFRLPRSLRK